MMGRRTLRRAARRAAEPARRRFTRDACAGKVRYPGKRSATVALRTLNGNGKTHGRMHAYPCGDHWHLGHAERLERVSGDGR